MTIDLSKLVKPLQFADETGDGVLTSRETGTLYRVFPQRDGTFFAPRLGFDEPPVTDPQVLIEKLNKHHAARVLDVLDADALREFVGFVRQVASYGPDKDHNDNRNDLIACEAVGIAEAILAKLGLTP